MAELLPTDFPTLLIAGLIDALEEPPDGPPHAPQLEMDEDAACVEPAPEEVQQQPLLMPKLVLPAEVSPAAKTRAVTPVWKRPPPRYLQGRVSRGASPSSLARNTKPQVPPSQRAKEHRKRESRMAARRSPTPGPAHYSPVKADRSVDVLASTSFRSKTAGAGQLLEARDFVSTASPFNGPGAYRPNEGGELANVARASFSKLGRSGAHAFGSTSNRELPLVAAHQQETPGPQHYATTRTNESIGSVGGGSTSGTAAFVSISPQRLPPPTRDGPGPATYDPNVDSVMPSRETHSPSKVGRDSRYVSDVLSFAVTAATTLTAATVAPGAYDGADRSQTIQQELERTLDRTSRANASGTVGFGMRRLDGDSHKLPHEALLMHGEKGSPGPGAYEQAALPAAEGNGHSSAFATRTKRMDESVEARMFGGRSGDNGPGSYDAHAPRELAAAARESFSKTMKAGNGNFGTNAERKFEERERPARTPGPAAYNPDSALVRARAPIGFVESLPGGSAAFRSASPQRPTAWHANDHPGPADYDPQLTAVKPVAPYSPSKVGRESRYVSDRLTIAGPDCGPNVGPSSYDPRKTRGGDWATISDRVEEQRQMGGSNSMTFLSDALRNLFHFFMPGEVGAALQF